MKLKINRTQTYAHEVEVTFPLYTWSGDVYDDGSGGYDTYTKIEEDGTCHEVIKRMVGYTKVFDYTFTKGKLNFLVELDRYLKHDKSDEADFQKVLAEAKAALDTFPKEQQP